MKSERVFDVMEEYEKSPEEAIKVIQKISKGEDRPILKNIPLAFDLPGFPTSSHSHSIVTIYGAVLKLGGVKFRNEGERRVDYQEIRVQERNNMHLPQSLTVHLEDRLVDSCKPGEILRITGLVKLVWNKIRQGAPLDCEYVIIALEIEKEETKKLPNLRNVTEKNEYDLLIDMLSHFAPQIYGYREVKLAILLCKIGGSSKRDEKEEKDAAQSTEERYRELQYRTRSSSHILITGSTGTGKTEFLTFASKIATPSVITTGTGCSSAGLTACALREDGEWVIEPGALPQADQGICCIDDFTSLGKDDRSSILEAMEQQTITVAKAGILMRLDSRCTIVAAARNEEKTREKVLDSLKLSPPLLSRFDLVMSMDDNAPHDKNVSEHVVGRGVDDFSVSYIRDAVGKRREARVYLSEECKEVISRYYDRQREVPSTTVRALESHIRLTEAYAKLMGREVANEKDALITALLMNTSLSANRIWDSSIESSISSAISLEAALENARSSLFPENNGF